MYDSKELQEIEHCDSYIEFITTQENAHLFWYPIIAACFYTLVWPIIRVCIAALYTKIEKWGEGWHLKLAKGASIPIERYLEYRTTYTELQTTLEKVIAAHTETKEELNKKTSEYIKKSFDLDERLAELKNTNSLLTEEVNMLNPATITSKLLGTWNILRRKGQTDTEASFDIKIDDNYMYFLFEQTYQKVYKIDSIVADPSAKRIALRLTKLIDHPNLESPLKANQILFFENDFHIKGYENEELEIAYIAVDRKQNTPPPGN